MSLQEDREKFLREIEELEKEIEEVKKRIPPRSGHRKGLHLAILEIKEISRIVTKEQASLIAEKALDMDSPKEIEHLLRDHYPLKRF